MSESLFVYCFTMLVFAAPWPILWYCRRLTALAMVVFLFFLDSALTLEAAYYSDIVSIALLHVFTIPALFGIITLDLVRQSKTQFRCFLCNYEIRGEEEMIMMNRTFEGQKTKVVIHRACVEQGERLRKPLSRRLFRNGIPT